MAFRTSPWDDEFLRLRLVLGAMLFALSLLGAALWRIQVAHGERYATDQSEQSVRRVSIPGMRGRLYDRQGAVLADNRPSYCLAIYMEELRQRGRWSRTIEKVESILSQLGHIIGTESTLTREDIRAHIDRRLPLPLIAWRDLDEESLARLAEQGVYLPGVDIYTEAVRVYPQKRTLCHVLGYVGRAEPPAENSEEAYHYYLPDMAGKAGLEKTLDPLLRGEAGGRLLLVDVTGYRRQDLGERVPRIGDDVQLTIDAQVQRFAEEALGDVPGSVVVLDPRNGEVLAMASSPGYDPNEFVPFIRRSDWATLTSDPQKPLLNRAISGRYAPGSTFKPVTALAALESGKCRSSETWNCPGYFELGRAVFRCWQHSGHGALSLREALERSCNVYFFHYGLQSGPDYLAHMARALGLGQKLGVELEGETAGLVPDGAWKRSAFSDAWRDGDTCNMSIGQGALAVTPLQMAVVASTVANGGQVYRPRLVRGIRAQGSGPFVPKPVEVLNTMNWTEAHLRDVREGMRRVVNGADGTAKVAAVPGITVAGKTGTAEFGRKEERRRHAWMIAFAPYEQPRYAVAMLVDEGLSGSETAAPRMGRLLGNIFSSRSGEGRG